MALYALHLLHSQLILSHSKSSLEVVFLSTVPLNHCAYGLTPPPIELGLHLELVGLVQLLVLSIAHDVLEVLVQFCINHIAENVGDLLRVMVNHKKFALILLASALEKNTEVPSNALKVSEAD
jgi:hypothetical protein